MLPTSKECSITEEQTDMGGILNLLTKRLLCSYSHGGIGEEALQHFITTFFSSVRNVTYTSGMDNPTGIILSRCILSLSGVVSNITDINTAPGFLIRVDVPKGHDPEFSLQLKAAWDDFYWGVRDEPGVITLGYVYSSCGTSAKRRYGGTYRHYFFVSCKMTEQGPGKLSRKELYELPFRPLYVAQIDAVVPFTCGTRSPVVVVISVGDGSKKRLLSDGKPDQTARLQFFPYDVSSTLASLHEYEALFLTLLREQIGGWQKTVVVHVDIMIDYSRRTGLLPVFLWDLIGFIGELCDNTGTNIIGVCYSDDVYEEMYGFSKQKKEYPSCYLNATLKHVLESPGSFDVSTCPYGSVPQCIRRPISSSKYEYAHKRAEKWLPYFSAPIVLNRITFTASANDFARCKYYVRNRVVGENVLLVTDDEGSVFCLDIRTGSLSLLPKCVGCFTCPVKNSVFSAVVTSSYRGYMECIVVVEDILCFEGNEMTEIQFPERWFYVEKFVLNSCVSHPHTSPDNITIVRTTYAPSAQAGYLLTNPPLSHPTMGLVFVPCHFGYERGRTSVYSWIPAYSITAVFSVGDVFGTPLSDNCATRISLCAVDDHGNPVLYNNEYVDCISDSALGIKKGSIVECVLRRSKDGSHWWELLRCDLGNEKKRSTYTDVENLVHVPVLSYEEMIWLLDASKFKCARCQSVSDAGRKDPRSQIYWCKGCWMETNHGDCLYCGRTFVVGKIDCYSQNFYCDPCWTTFSTINSGAEAGHVGLLPSNSSLPIQALVWCASLLIDTIASKTPTDDVLDMCSEGLITPKWIKNKTTRYVGFNIKASVVDETKKFMESLRQEMPSASFYDIICADVLAPDFWSHVLMKVHPRQFHVITAFSGLHHAFETESKAKVMIESVAKALVPGGVFIAFFLDVYSVFAKDLGCTDVFTIEWGTDFVPRIGQHVLLSMYGGPFKKLNVIPVDFLVAVGQVHGLNIITEACSSFKALLDDDKNFTKLISNSEKEYLSIMRAVAFRKEGGQRVCAPPSTTDNANREH